MLAAAVWLGVLELVDSRNEEVGEGEDPFDVAAAAGVCVDGMAAFWESLVAAVFLFVGVEVACVFRSFFVGAACVVAAAAFEADASDSAIDAADADASAAADDSWAACFEFELELSFELAFEFEMGVLSGAAGMVMYPPIGPSKVFAAVL